MGTNKSSLMLNTTKRDSTTATEKPESANAGSGVSGGGTKAKSSLMLSTFKRTESTKPKSSLMLNTQKNNGGIAGAAKYLGANAIAGFTSMFEGVSDLVAGTAAQLSGDEALAKYLYTDNVVGSWQQRQTEDYNPGTVMKFLGDVSAGIGNSAVMMIPYAGTAAFFAGAVGQGIGEAVSTTGELGAKEYIYGGLSGATEGALEKVTSGASNIFGKIGKGAVTGTKSAFVKSVISEGAGEFFEEFMGDIIETHNKRVILGDKETQYDLGQALYSGFVGMASGATLGTINTAGNYTYLSSQGKTIKKNGNTQTLINTAKTVTDFISGDIKINSKMSEDLKNLSADIKEYERQVADGKEVSDTLLGEIQARLACLESKRGVLLNQAKLEGMTDAQLEAVAEAYTNATGIKVTAEDIRTNKNNAATAIAIVDWASGLMSEIANAELEAAEDNIIASQKKVNDGIPDIETAEEKTANAAKTAQEAVKAQNGENAEGDLKTVADGLKSAQKAQSETDSTKTTQPTTAKNTEFNPDDESQIIGGKYFVKRAEDYTFRVAQVTGIDKKTGKRKWETLANYVDAEEVERIISNGKAKTEAKAETKTETKAETESKTETAGTDEGVKRDIGEPTEGDSVTADNAYSQTTVKTDTATDVKSGEKTDTKRDNKVKDDAEKVKADSKIKKKYSDGEQERARGYVKDFDGYTYSTRASILDFLRSCTKNNVQDKVLIKSLANILTLDSGLRIRFEAGIGVPGFHAELPGGRTFIVLNSERQADAIRTTAVHELVHELEGKSAYKSLADYVERVAPAEALKKTVDRYTEWYKKHNLPEPSAELLKSESTAHYVASKIGNKKFIERYAKIDSSGFSKLCRAVRTFAKLLGGKDRAAQMEIVNITRMFDEALVSVGNDGRLKNERAVKNKVGAFVYANAGKDKGESKSKGNNAKYSIGILENGNSFVIYDRNVITSTDTNEMRRQITSFFNKVLNGKDSIDIPTINGEVLTITKSETANKARDNYKTENGKSRKLNNEEFAVKLRAESHIDELAEVSSDSGTIKADTKNHKFADKGFTYRTAYFQDFDNAYYKITLSIANNSDTAVIYNVGKIEKNALPSAKLIAVVGSPAPWNAFSDNSISQETEKSTENQKNVEKKFDIGEDEERIKAIKSIESEINAAGLQLTSKENNKNNVRIKQWLNEHYPEYVVDFRNDKATGTVKVLEVQTAEGYQDKQQRTAQEHAEKIKHERQMQEFFSRVTTPSGFDRLVDSVTNSIYKAYPNCAVEKSHSSVHSMSFYVKVFNDSDNYVGTIKISDHNTIRQQMEYDNIAFLDLHDYASMTELNQEIKEIIKRSLENDSKATDNIETFDSGNPDIRYDIGEEEYEKPINAEDVQTLRDIGKKSINDFTSEEIKKTAKWAFKFYRELGTKSPFFRAWFGDWRAYENNPETDAIITKYGYSEHLPIKTENRKVRNDDTEFEITIDDNTFGDSLHYASINGDKKQINQILGRIDEITKNAILFDTQISDGTKSNKKGSTSFMHYLYAPITVNNAPFLVKLTVEEYGVESNKRGYNVRRIKMSELQTSQFSKLIRKSRKIGSSVSDGISIADLYSLVKTYDKDFRSGKDVNRLMLNDDGTPKVFYHGTNAEFTAFDISKSGKNFKGLSEGMFFFTNKKNAYPNSATDYARESVKRSGGKEIVKAVYLNIKNPLMIDSKGYYSTSEYYDKNKEAIYNKYLNGDYDGIIVENSEKNYDDAILAAVDNSTQIKSATDNIGTFDSGNPDIRYDIGDEELQQRMEIADTEGGITSCIEKTTEKNGVKLERERLSEIVSGLVRAIRSGSAVNAKLASASAAVNIIGYGTIKGEDGGQVNINEAMPQSEQEALFAKLQDDIYAYLQSIPDSDTDEGRRADAEEAEKALDEQRDEKPKRRRRQNNKTEERTPSAGQTAFETADRTQKKVYRRSEAEDILRTIIADRLNISDDISQSEGAVSGKTLDSLIEYLYEKLNSAEPGKRAGVAIKIADVIIDNAIMTDTYDARLPSDEALQTASERVNDIRKYMHKLDLSGIKDEIKYKDRKGAYIVWGARKNGTSVSIEAACAELAESGIIIEQGNTADMFNRLLEIYSENKEIISRKLAKWRLSECGGRENLAEIRREIQADVLNAYETHGADSSIARTARRLEDKVYELTSELKQLKATVENLKKYAPGKTYTKAELIEAIKSYNRLIKDGDITNLLKGKDVKLSGKETEIITLMLSAEANATNIENNESALRRLSDAAADEYLAHAEVVTSGEKADKGNTQMLSSVYDSRTLENLRLELSDKIYDDLKNKLGKETGFKTAAREATATADKYTAKLTEERGLAKEALYVINTVKALRRELDIKRRTAVSDEQITALLKMLTKSSTEGGRINARAIDAGIEQLSAAFTDSEGGRFAELFGYGKDDLTGQQGYEARAIRTKLDEFTESRKTHASLALTARELRLFGDIIGGFKTICDNADRYYSGGKWRNLDEDANAGVRDLENYYLMGGDGSRGGEKKGAFAKIWKSINEFYNYGVLTPEAVIAHLEAYSEHSYLTEAMHRIRYACCLSDARYKHLMEEFRNFEECVDSDGKRRTELYWTDEKGRKRRYGQKLLKKTVNVQGTEMALGQGIYLYMVTKRAIAEDGLVKEGFALIDEDGRVGKHVGGTELQYIRQDLISQFDETDKQYIQLAERFFNVTASGIKQEMDMQYLGYTNISGGYYVPIYRDRFKRGASVTDARKGAFDIITVYNERFNQNTVKNATALEIKNIATVIDTHAKGLSDYAELYMPLKAFDRLYNKKTLMRDGKMRSYREVLEGVYDKSGRFISKLMNDIQGVGTNDGGASSTINKAVGWLRGNWVQSVLSANPKVIVTQTSSLVAATRMIDPQYLTKAIIMSGETQKAVHERAYKYSDIIYARNFDMEALKAEGNIEKLNKVGKTLGAGIGWMDNQICERIWRASELQIEAKTGKAVGTDENIELAKKLCDETIMKTQQMMSNAERSDFMRSKSETLKMFTMFTSDAMKLFSSLFEGIEKYRIHNKRAKSDVNYKKYLKQDAKDLRRSCATYAAVSTALAIIAQGFKHIYNKDEDDLGGKLKDFFGGDMISSFLGIFPIFSELYSKFADGYDINLEMLDFLNDLIDSTKESYTVIAKLASGQKVTTQEVLSPTRKTIRYLGTITGIPVSAAETAVIGLIRRFAPAAAYKYDSLFYSLSYTSDLAEAVEKGDDRLAEAVTEMMYRDASTGECNTECIEEAVRLYQTGYKQALTKSIPDSFSVGEGDEKETVTLNAKQTRTYKQVYSEAYDKVYKLMSTDAYKSLDDKYKAYAIGKLYQLYTDRAKAAVSEKYGYTTLSAYYELYSDDVTLALVLGYANQLKDAKDANGEALYTSSEKQKLIKKYIKSLGANGDTTVLTYAAGGHSSDAKEKMKKLISKLDDKEKQEKILGTLGLE